jgi:hypothetical protein
MKRSRHSASYVVIILILFAQTSGAKHNAASNGPVTPYKTVTKQGQYTIESVGDTLGQASAQNTRIILRISGPDKKLVKPGAISLVDKSGAALKPVFREDRKVGHEENTGLPFSMDSGGGVGINLNKVFGSHGDYAYTKVDWPRNVFTGDKSLQITMPTGQTLMLPVSGLAR